MRSGALGMRLFCSLSAQLFASCAGSNCVPLHDGTVAVEVERGQTWQSIIRVPIGLQRGTNMDPQSLNVAVNLLHIGYAGPRPREPTKAREKISHARNSTRQP